ncbi:hypothetical protein GW17_00037224 [Ensete ventricosum]|nr:hypothetical protein GW17_00037224 [Ensete ventricosum]RZS10983.1 hypothetical protein BHM03_00042273 [Ensete ventricosum]
MVHLHSLNPPLVHMNFKTTNVLVDEDFIPKNYEDSIDMSTVIDPRMVSSFTLEGMKEFLRLITWCLNPSSERRPPMDYVEMELQRIHEKELQLTTVMGEGTTTVTLGSQLFRA